MPGLNGTGTGCELCSCIQLEKTLPASSRQEDRCAVDPGRSNYPPAAKRMFSLSAMLACASDSRSGSTNDPRVYTQGSCAAPLLF